MRFDGHRYRDCRWCGGAGCLQCEAEAEKAYRREFPDGPQPIATFRLDDPASMAKARKVLSPEALNEIFGKGGGGLEEFKRRMEND